jgi:oxygen-independent coproporphyrinogen-3 oxidase
LAVKRGSKLIENDKDYAYRQGENVRQMLDDAAQQLKNNGYSPYYLYRQKHMAGNFENVGYCKPGCASLYNMRIMEENQSIIALGAGGISKVYYPEEDRLERIPNVSNYEIYIDRIDDMIDRKKKGFF